MTAETLKPFITPTSAADNCTAIQSSAAHSQRKSNLVAIGLTIAAFTLAFILLGFTIWNSMRIQKMQTELSDLNKIVESLKIRLGINYLDELSDFEKEYTNALIDDPRNLDDKDIVDDDQDDDIDSDDDDDVDDEDEDVGYIEYGDKYDDKYESYDEEDTNVQNNDDETDDETSNTSGNDNLFDDHEKFLDSKKRRKSQRTTRSISEVRNEIQTYDESYMLQQNKSYAGDIEQQAQPREDTQKHRGHVLNSANHSPIKRQIVAENREPRRSPLHMRTIRRRKFPVLKSGESLISAKSSARLMSATPAVHFHLNRRVPHHTAPIRLDSYPGDMYIGQASVTSDNAWQIYFNVDNGVLTVREPGLYYVYAQICYNNTHDQNGFVIFHGHRPFLQCLNTVPTNMPVKIHTCHTSGLIHLQENETIHLRDFHSDRNVILKDANNRSYFGIVKI